MEIVARTDHLDRLSHTLGNTGKLPAGKSQNLHRVFRPLFPSDRSLFADGLVRLAAVTFFTFVALGAVSPGRSELMSLDMALPATLIPSLYRQLHPGGGLT
jgi:hypothetical protein